MARKKAKAAEENAPLLHQVLNGVDPVVPVTVKVRTSVAFTVQGRPVYRDEEVSKTVRRLLDARLWDRLDVDQQEAAMQVYGAWRAVTVGVGMRISDPSRPPGAGMGAAQVVEFNVSLRATWQRWVAACKDADLNWRAACEVLCHGKSTREVDSLCQRRTGWCAELLERTLDQWCFIRHWKHDGRVRPRT